MGLKYDQKIDIWSLGCVLVELHTGEPLFGGSDQMDQMCRIVDVLGMPPYEMIEQSPTANKSNFFLKVEARGTTALPADCDMERTRYSPDGQYFYVLRRPNKTDMPPARSLAQIIGVHTGGPFGRRKDEAGHTVENYQYFQSFIASLLRFDPTLRSSAVEAQIHPYITEILDSMATEDNDAKASSSSSSSATATTAAAEGSSTKRGGGEREGGQGDGDGVDDGPKRRGREQVDWKPRS